MQHTRLVYCYYTFPQIFFSNSCLAQRCIVRLNALNEHISTYYSVDLFYHTQVKYTFIERLLVFYDRLFV